MARIPPSTACRFRAQPRGRASPGPALPRQGVIRVCTEGSRPGIEPPGSVGAALRMMDAALDFLNGDYLAGSGLDPAGLAPAGLAEAELGGVLESLSVVSGKLAAARSAVLARFDAARGHDADGYGSSASWLAAKGRTTRKAAGAEVRRMRQFTAHPVIAAAVARGDLSPSWAGRDRQLDRQAPGRLARRHRQAAGRHRLGRRQPGRPRRRRPGRLREMAVAAARPRRPRRRLR